MKVPLIWLKDYLDTPKSGKAIAQSFTQLGLMLDKPLGENGVLDLEHRMDRSDWLSITGCARDLAAFEGIPLKLPKGYSKIGHRPLAIDRIPVIVQTPAVRRFQTRVFRGVKVAASPQWLAQRLKAYGIEPKNNVVDITNFVMVEYGQPMHAQDISRLKSREITLRQAKSGEKLITLLGTEVKLDPDIFVLSSGGEITVIGGIVGGKNTGVTDQTTDIILDAGNYDSRLVRKTSRRLKIINETVSRYDKFLDPRLIDTAMERATDLMLNIAGGNYYDNDDYYPHPVKPKNQVLRLSRLHLLSGMDLTLGSAKKILQSLDYAIVEEGEGSLTVEIPSFRTDVEVEDDLISDILRISNYTHIPTLPLSTPPPADITPPLYRFEDRLRDLLVGQGAHEHITSSLVTASPAKDEIKLVNALSADQNALRRSLIPSLKRVLATYVKHKLPVPLVFEIGQVFLSQDGRYLEERHLTVISASDCRDSLATLLSSLGIRKYRLTKDHSLYCQNTLIGTITSNSYTILTEQLPKLTISYQGIVSEFVHPQSLDLSLLAPAGVIYADIIGIIDSLKGGWQSILCKSTAQIGNRHNYLLTVTWSEKSNSVASDKDLILRTLQTKLKITSKS